MQIHKVPDELKTLWNMGLVHITTHNLKRGVGIKLSSTRVAILDFQSACDSQFRRGQEEKGKF
jgi:hypothetical protein